MILYSIIAAAFFSALVIANGNARLSDILLAVIWPVSLMVLVFIAAYEAVVKTIDICRETKDQV